MDDYTSHHTPNRARRSDPEDMLPIDPDTNVSDAPVSGPARPIHLRWRYISLVAVGGTVGSAAREAVSLAIPPMAGIPVAIFLINIAGALFLGALLESLARRGPDEGRRRTLRLLLGTGFAGGFTTYSALATDTGFLLAGGQLWDGAGYAVVTVVVGAVATLTGIGLAAGHHRRQLAAAGGDR
ncbi:fluoride efflux transporter FluC [Agreia pratensis]|uniref:Fluoride-specific ion channel FluC n=1 Tax=Agreia pratensis TaxID=150121 RepID=A0A1X7KRX7_9MICO|nr:camphor resistance protein CrcB [Agreia pratensis]